LTSREEGKTGSRWAQDSPTSPRERGEKGSDEEVKQKEIIKTQLGGKREGRDHESLLRPRGELVIL